MRGWGRFVALGASVAAAFGLAAGALAEPDPFDPVAPADSSLQSLDVADPPTAEQARFLLFSSTDLWRQGGFAHGGLLWAPAGIDRDGLVLKLVFGGGIYHYTSGALGNAEVRGQMLGAAILPGYRLVRDKFAATLFLGYDFQRHTLTPDDPSAGLRGNYIGVRAGFDVWCEPTAMTMLAADASISSIGPSYNARLAAGLLAFESFYVGPEVQAFAADDNYRQFRAGLHITGLRIGGLEWTAGAGWATDSDDRSGAYGKLGMLARR